jgi:hypothetical protein
MPNTGSSSKIWIIAFTVFFPLIYVPIAFVIFFSISWLLAMYVFSSQPLPFRFFAFSGIAIGILLTTINAWRARKPLAGLLGKR